MGQSQSSDNEYQGSSSTKVMEYFNLKKFLSDSKWYEVARYNEHHSSKCSKIINEFILNKENGSIDVTNYCYNGNKKEVNSESIVRKKSLQSRAGDLLISIDDENWGEYNLLWTDYKNIAFITGKNYSSLWVLTRFNEITEDRCDEICECIDKLEVLCGAENIKKWKLVWNDKSPLYVKEMN